MEGCLCLGLPEWLAASVTALGKKVSIFLHLSPSHPPQLCCHTFVADLSSHSMAVPWLCGTSLRCLWCVCVFVCVGCGAIFSLRFCCGGAWIGRDMTGGWAEACRTPLAAHQALFSLCFRSWNVLASFLSPFLFCLALPQLLGHLTPLLWPKAAVGLLLPTPLPKQAAACLPCQMFFPHRDH